VNIKLLTIAQAEQDRLDFQHAGFLVLLGGMLYLAPLSHPKKVLDVATGTGIWAVEFAEKHPDAEVLGTDLSAIQPSNAPPNCSFIKDDSEGEWLFPHKFDYVHLRFVFSCFDKPREIMRNAFNSMSSGGWIEYQDGALGETGSIDGNLDGTDFQKWQQSFVKGLQAALGRDVEVAPRYKGWLEEAGFVNVCERRVMWPIGPWSDDKRLNRAGAYMLQNYTSAALLAGWKSVRASGVPEDEARNLIEGAKRELADRNNRFYMVIYIVYGQKP
jgi:SAM-dependent methyltransferase